MPTGKLIDPGGDSRAKKGLGSILGTDGKCFLFKNDAPGKLKSGDPIVFYIEPAEVDLLKQVDTKYEIAVAYLHPDEFKKPHLTKNTWYNFKTFWDEEWELEETDKIKKLGFDKNFEESGDIKKGLKGLEKFNDIEDKRPKKENG